MRGSIFISNVDEACVERSICVFHFSLHFSTGPVDLCLVRRKFSPKWCEHQHTLAWFCGGCLFSPVFTRQNPIIFVKHTNTNIQEQARANRVLLVNRKPNISWNSFACSLSAVIVCLFLHWIWFNIYNNRIFYEFKQSLPLTWIAPCTRCFTINHFPPIHLWMMPTALTAIKWTQKEIIGSSPNSKCGKQYLKNMYKFSSHFFLSMYEFNSIRRNPKSMKQICKKEFFSSARKNQIKNAKIISEF